MIEMEKRISQRYLGRVGQRQGHIEHRVVSVGGGKAVGSGGQRWAAVGNAEGGGRGSRREHNVGDKPNGMGCTQYLQKHCNGHHKRRRVPGGVGGCGSPLQPPAGRASPQPTPRRCWAWAVSQPRNRSSMTNSLLPAVPAARRAGRAGKGKKVQRRTAYSHTERYMHRTTSVFTLQLRGWRAGAGTIILSSIKNVLGICFSPIMPSSPVAKSHL